jgi:hypothetical protein
MILSKNNTLLYITTSFFSGGILLCSEVLIGKIIGKYYGNTLFSWVIILIVSLLAIFLGYNMGARLANKTNFRVYKMLLILSLLFVNIYLFDNKILNLLFVFPYELGLIANTIILLFPLILLLSAITPIMIRELSKYYENSYGIILAVSTIGGVVFTLIGSLYIIPFLGLSFLTLIFGVLILILTFIYYLVSLKVIDNQSNTNSMR